ncbi:MAG: hypothetical protein ACTSYA_02475, partial [Candidatus Kariarchaeaceae archaeon]
AMIGTNANLKPFPTEYISNVFYATGLIFCVTVAKNASSAITRPSWTHNLFSFSFLYEVVDLCYFLFVPFRTVIFSIFSSSN